MTHYFDDLSVLVKVILLILLGGLISPVYRILRFLETKNVVTLVVGIVCLVTGVGNFIFSPFYYFFRIILTFDFACVILFSI